jgi:hypothetical protein
MEMINRCAVVVQPAQPFFGLAAPSRSNKYGTGAGRPETGAYDLPLAGVGNRGQEALQHLTKVCSEIFEEQLNGWYGVPSVWPEERNLNAFLRWFDYSFHSMVLDLCAERLLHNDM